MTTKRLRNCATVAFLSLVCVVTFRVFRLIGTPQNHGLLVSPHPRFGTTNTTNEGDDDNNNFNNNGNERPFSSVSEIGPGLDVWKNVCLLPRPSSTKKKNQKAPRSKKREVLALYSLSNDILVAPYSNHNNEDEGEGQSSSSSSLDQFNKALPIPPQLVTRQEQYVVWIQEPTLLTVTASNGNPAHCLNDVAVSLALTRNTKPMAFVNIHEWRFFLPFNQSTAGEWCYNVLTDTQLIPLPIDQYYNPAAEQLQQQQMQQQQEHDDDNDDSTFMTGPCFGQLFLPRYVRYRTLPTVQAEQALLYIQEKLSTAYNLSREPLSLPTSTVTDKITTTSTPTPTTNTTIPRVLLYDRTGTTRRVLQNAPTIQALLEQRYHVHVDLMQGPDWKRLATAAQQLQWYNHNRYHAYIAPHGAHFANLLGARPGSRVVEILCSVRWNDTPINPIMTNTMSHPDDMTNNHDNNTKNNNLDDWYNINGTVKLQQWFARNGQVLGIQVFHYREKEGCRKTKAESPRAYGGTPPARISVDHEKFVAFVANRLLLVPK